MDFQWLEIEAFAQATEDNSRVKDAMYLFLPFKPKDRKDFKLDECSVTGTFGNEITIYRARLKKQPDINGVWKRVFSHINKEELAGEIEERLDSSLKFCMRFDKQIAYTGKFSLGGEDVVQLKGKVAAYPAKKENALKTLKKFFGNVNAV